MPKPTLILAITLAMLLPAQREAPSVVGARTFVSLDSRFSITLPNHNGFGPLTIPTPFGEAQGVIYQWQTKEATFGVGQADAPQTLNNPDAVKQFFNSASERFNKVAAANSGNVAPVKQISLEKYPGIEQRVDLFTGSVIQRTYVAAQRIYEIVAVLKNNQRVYETVAIGVLDTFKVLSEEEVKTSVERETAKAEPSPLPQMPVAPRAGSDVSDEGLRGRVRSVLTEIQDLSGTWSVQERIRNSFDTYNEQGNKIRTESYDYRGNLFQINVYGFIDGSRVTSSKTIQHEYNPPPVIVTRGLSSEGTRKKSDPRFQYRFEFKYDEKKRLVEKTWFQSNGDTWMRYVYKYNGNQSEELVYSEDGSLNRRYLYKLDEKGNEIERTFFEANGTAGTKQLYTYEFDANGNWTKRTMSRLVMKDGREQPEPYSMSFRTITYY